jgi:hypothetical protein
LRILPIKPEPNWNDGITLKLFFETTMFSNERLREKRRPLVERTVKETDARYLTQGLNAQTFFEEITYGKDKIFAVPLYYEGLRVSACTQGQDAVTTLDATTDLKYYTGGSGYCVISDHQNLVSEIKQISTVTTNQIDMVNNITKTMDPKYSLIYPVFFGMIKNVRITNHTDALLSVELTFMEYTGG